MPFESVKLTCYNGCCRRIYLIPSHPNNPRISYDNKADKQDVICLIAPTASGKTALAYELYETGKYRLISVDSALIYRDMNIGTAKPTPEELHKSIHMRSLTSSVLSKATALPSLSAMDYHINLAHQQNKTPVLVGGTMMYYMALIQGINDIPATLPETRQQVTQLIAEQGIEQLHAYLTQVDPILGKQLKTTDTQRIGRAVEIYLQTGKPLSAWQNQPARALADNPNQRWQILAVMPDRDWLHKRIALRLDIMWQQGFCRKWLPCDNNITSRLICHPCAALAIGKLGIFRKNTKYNSVYTG